MGRVLKIFIVFSGFALTSSAALQTLQNVQFGKCLRLKEDTDLGLVECNPNDINQSFTVEKATPYTVYLKLNGKCISNYQRATGDNVKVILWECQGLANQRWVTFGADYFFVPMLEEQKKCLSASGTNGDSIVQTTCGSDLDPTQTWIITILE